MTTISKLSVIAAGAVAALALSACHEHTAKSATDLPPGKYEKTTSSTNAQGTTTTREQETNVMVDEYGNKRAVVESKTTKDPKGLFNKTTTYSTKEVVDER